MHEKELENVTGLFFFIISQKALGFYVVAKVFFYVHNSLPGICGRIFIIWNYRYSRGLVLGTHACKCISRPWVNICSYSI
jgi:hypothetical protein